MKLELRTEITDTPNDGIWYTLQMNDATKYSVVNIGQLMKSFREKVLTMEQDTDNIIRILDSMFLGWEAMLLKPDGGLDSEVVIREETEEKLLEIIKAMHPSEL